MRNKKAIALLLSIACAASLLTGCQTTRTDSQNDTKETASASSDSTDNKDEDVSEHETITIESPFRSLSPFMKILKEKYPEITFGGDPVQRKEHNRISERPAQRR